MGNFFKKIFNKRQKPKQPITKKELDDSGRPVSSDLPTTPNGTKSSERVEPLQFQASSGQSVGRQREHNEDALFCQTSTLASNGTELPFGLYIVADGMGGHQFGEVASNLAVRSMAEHIMSKLYTPLISLDGKPPEQSIKEILEMGVQNAHQEVQNKASGGGTTITSVLMLGNQMSIAHVGDSRVYSVDSLGKLKPLTRDHSLVQRLQELGQITPEEAAVHPQRNVLYRALGQSEPFDAEIIINPLPRDGYLLICSDGLWGVVPEDEIGDLILNAGSTLEACQEMVKAANEAGGPDNITAILVKLPG